MLVLFQVLFEFLTDYFVLINICMAAHRSFLVYFTDTLDKHHISLTPDHVYDIEKMEPSEIIDSILQDNCPPSGLFVFSDEIALQLSNIADPDRPSENVTLDVRLVERNSVSTQ